MMLYMLVDSPDSQICGFIGLSPYSVQRSVAHFIVTTTSSRSAFRFVGAIRKVSWFRHRLYIEYVPTQSLGFATPRSVWPIIFITCAHCTLRETVIHFVHCHIQSTNSMSARSGGFSKTIQASRQRSRRTHWPVMPRDMLGWVLPTPHTISTELPHQELNSPVLRQKILRQSVLLGKPANGKGQRQGKFRLRNSIQQGV